MIKTFIEKDYKIKIWEQEPTMDWELRDFSNDIQCSENIRGTHAYQVFNPKGESIYLAHMDMWDEDACYQNAVQDIEADGD